jgi:hypothetical protein
MRPPPRARDGYDTAAAVDLVAGTAHPRYCVLRYGGTAVRRKSESNSMGPTKQPCLLLHGAVLRHSFVTVKLPRTA